jgi:peptide/nickel transport system permease protein
MPRPSGRFYIAAAIFLVILGFGVIGPLCTSTQVGQVVGGLYDPPSGHSWLGTDNLGHDVLTNLMYGTRTSLVIGLVAGSLATAIGVLIGTASGYRGGFVDNILMAFTNIVLTVPAIVLVVLISVSLPTRSNLTLAFVIAIVSWPWTARAVRAQTSSIRTREHIDVAKLSGAKTPSIILWDVLPYQFSYIAMAFVLQVSAAILTEASLSLLGIGPSNGVSLGIMLHWSLAFESVRTGAWWAFVPPTLILTFIAFGLLMLQSSLDEVFNPRLRRNRRRRGGVAAPTPGAAVIEVEEGASA